jgi:hypothetical protein
MSRIHRNVPSPLRSANISASSLGNLTPGGRVSVHGMVTFGDPKSGTVFMSHIPMFHHPHDFQALFAVKVPSSVKTFSDDTYTFKPEAFSLDDLLLGRLKQVKGTLFRGNFESGGRPLEDVTCEVTSTVTATPLDPAPKLAPLEYVVVGSQKDAYAVHTITDSPGDFDQILKVDVSKTGLTDEQLAAGVPLAFPGRGSDVAARLKTGDVTARVKATQKDIPLRVEKELSSLVGPHFTDPPR